jgi:hypothetical protein
MVDQKERLAGILERAEQIHGIVTEKTGGADPDWALFYAWWLINWSDLPDVLGARPVLGELTARLVSLDVEYRSASRAEPWSAFYAGALLAGTA